MFYSSQYQELYHFGVKGMKWGVRKQRYLAKKDAKETARAKMYYGDGAGVRRRQIKAIVKQRSKDPTYKKAYDISALLRYMCCKRLFIKQRNG